MQDRAALRWLVAFALAIGVFHHVGTLTGPLGELGGGMEWGDWVDLLTPYAVVGTAVGCLATAGAGRVTWVLAALGSVVYVQGHGIHLAANSIGNARGDEAPVHLWDEVIGHYLWFTGLYLLLLALALALRGRPVTSPWGWPLALLVGSTLLTNGIEGGTAVFTLLVCLAFAGWGARVRDPQLLATFALPVLGVAGWGIAHQGFPQFSELGWF